MDALALFCNLHGDGPQTLALLREVGCLRLADIAELDPDTLGRILGRDASGVARFVREARVLGQRVEGELPPAAELVPQPPPQPQPREEVAEQAPEPTEPEPAESEPEPEPEAGPAPDSERTTLAKKVTYSSPPRPAAGPVAAAVLELWRTLDAAPSTGGGPATGAVPSAAPRPPAPPAAEPPAAELPVEAPSRRLADAGLTGLTASELEALAHVGIETVEDLAAADALELSRRTQLAYTHLAHVAFLARRLASAEGALFPVRRAARPGPTERVPEPSAETSDLAAGEREPSAREEHGGHDAWRASEGTPEPASGNEPGELGGEALDADPDESAGGPFA